MSKHKKKQPAMTTKSWIVVALIGLGLLGIFYLNVSFASQAQERIACHEALRAIAAAEAELRKTSQGLLEKTDPKDTLELLNRMKLLPPLPPHSGCPPQRPPYIFSQGGSVYCDRHGAEGSEEK